MVLTRYQQANLKPTTNTNEEKNPAKRRMTTSTSSSTTTEQHEAVLVKDPPLLTISRSRDSFDDDLNETTFKVDSLLEQLDE